MSLKAETNYLKIFFYKFHIYIYEILNRLSDNNLSVGQSKIPIDHAPYPKFSSSQIMCYIETVSKNDGNPKFEPITRRMWYFGKWLLSGFFVLLSRRQFDFKILKKSFVLYFHIVIFNQIFYKRMILRYACIPQRTEY